jgi:spore germination protein GerM
MKDQPQIRRVPLAIIAGVCGFTLATAGGITWWTTQNSRNSQSITTTPPITSPLPTNSPALIIPVPSPNLSATQKPGNTQSAIEPNSAATKPLTPSAEQIVKVYWLKDAGGKFQIVPTKIPLKEVQKPDIALQSAFDSLLAGPTDGNAQSEIPKGTKIESVKVSSDGIYVDLSKEFTSGGGSTSMIGRLGQVIFTATSLEPDAQVWISVDGKPLKLLGGEGLEVSQPITRNSFEKDFGIQ